jgi:hypothetical protein
MTGIIQSKGGGGERCTEIRNIEVPDLWHIAMALSNQGNPTAEKQVLDCWHLAHDMKVILLELDKVLPLMLQRATERIKELITDIQEMGDVEQLTVDNLNAWAKELSEYTGLFAYLPMGGDFMGSERNEAEAYVQEAMRLAEEISKEIDT